jgi:8-oxo-dGTP pyrophosphatase MutT (NUDIX family)
MREFSCGGVVLDGNKVLLVQVINFNNNKIWSFPKGHREAGENPRQTALREVYEETGYLCRVIKPLLRVTYYFTRSAENVTKSVQWFLMRKTGKTGKFDPVEINDVRWVSFKKAAQMLEYPSDKKLLYLAEAELTPSLRPLPEEII